MPYFFHQLTPMFTLTELKENIKERKREPKERHDVSNQTALVSVKYFSQSMVKLTGLALSSA